MRQNRATRSAAEAKSTQRKRLLVGMLAAINTSGYSGATVASVIARAGVSRPTFYEYFIDKDDCFLALYRELSRLLLDQIDQAVNDFPPELALHAVVRQLTKHAEHEPAEAQFLASDVLAGGPRALDERAQTIRQISKTVQAAHATASPKTRSPDLPTQLVIGATHSLVSQRICRGERNLAQLTHELTQWLTHYDDPISEHRWPTLNPGPLPELAPKLSQIRDQPAPQLLSRRSGLLSNGLAQSQRRRILCATAESAIQTGYAASTLTAITARASLRKPDFYDHFRHKHQAFLALHEIAFQQSMSVGAAAYFSAKRWPERVWRCLLATSQFHAAHPALAHVGLIETHALGLPAIQRVEASRGAFMTLLRADSQNKSPLLNATAAEAMGAAIFEIAHDRVRHQRAKDLPRYAYHAAYLALAPFVGVQAANRFVERKLQDAKKHERAATKRRGRA
jgi:AcrR family transcriptional regulator